MITMESKEYNQVLASGCQSAEHTLSYEVHQYQLNDLLTPAQAAKALTVTSGTLSVWRSTGRYNLPYVKVGRWVRYRWADVLSFIESRTHTQVS